MSQPVTATRPAQIRQIDALVPVEIFVIPGSEIRETRGECVLRVTVSNILSSVADKPGFIGFKTPMTEEIQSLLDGPDAGLLYNNETGDGMAEIAIYGRVPGRMPGLLTVWDRWVSALDEDSGMYERVFQIPFGAEMWVCAYITRSACNSLVREFYTPDPDERVI